MPNISPELLANVANFADSKNNNNELGATNQKKQGYLQSKMEDVGLVARLAGGDPTAVVEMAQKKISQVKEGLSTAASQGMSAFTTRNRNDINVGTAAGHGFRSAAGIFDAMGAEHVSAPLKFAATLAESVDKLRNWNNTLHQANARFAEFSGSMASVMAHAEVRDTLRNIRKGEARAASAGELERSRGNLEDAMEPLENDFADIQNTLTSALDDTIVPILETAAPVFHEAAKLLIASLHIWKSIVGSKAADKGEDFQLNTALEDWVEKQGAPGRWKR